MQIYIYTGTQFKQKQPFTSRLLTYKHKKHNYEHKNTLANWSTLEYLTILTSFYHLKKKKELAQHKFQFDVKLMFNIEM